MIDPKHPRAKSLRTRDLIVEGVKMGITSTHGLIAQGRGEAFDYLLDEQTQPFAKEAITAAAALLLLAKQPVLSVNGNSAALGAKDYIKLAELLNCPLEINLFHYTHERAIKIRDYLLSQGAKNLVGIDDELQEIKGIASPRKKMSYKGIVKADVVFVPLEDGDRTEILIKMNKKVITVDLNPLSRTAQQATVTIVDNLVRALPELIAQVEQLKNNNLELTTILKHYDNQKVLKEAITTIRQ